jgi:hypothetical protein
MVDFKRWMMAGQSPISPSSSRRSHTPIWKEADSRPTNETSRFGAERTITDPNSIEGVVQRLMDPLVSEEERRDYQRYVLYSPGYLGGLLTRLTG